jgi:hypothetical protein
MLVLHSILKLSAALLLFVPLTQARGLFEPETPTPVERDSESTPKYHVYDSRATGQRKRRDLQTEAELALVRRVPAPSRRKRRDDLQKEA